MSFVLEDQVNGKSYPCPPGVPLVVGRANPEAPPQVPVDDPRVSRVHCELVALPSGLQVTDRSSYGTYINSQRIQGAALAQAGDLIQLGAHYAFVLRSDAPAGGPIPEVFADRYRVLRELAHGGMGVVLEGVDTQTQRRCAIKLLKGNKVTALARFKREAEVGQRLGEHPGIVPVWEAGALPAGEPFYVMEFVEGASLSQRIRDGLPQADAVRLVSEVARAVHFAHERGVIHRDLKPQNVMVTPEGRARLTDFGVAKALDDPDDITATGAVMGTVTYMSPEQVEDSKRVDERTDVYGLGCVLYASLTGRPPVDLRGLSMRDALDRILEHDIKGPRALLGAARVDEALDAICLKAIERQPEDRYQTAGAFADALEGWLRGERTAPQLASAAAPSGAAPPEEEGGALVLFALIGVGLLAFAGLAAFALLR
ncbi:MAG: protein kinase [Planctomycetota bacterium]